MADHPARAVFAHQLRERRFQRSVVPHQRVILGVGNLRRILGMVQPVVMRDRLGEPHQFIGGFRFGEGCGILHRQNSTRSGTCCPSKA